MNDHECCVFVSAILPYVFRVRLSIKGVFVWKVYLRSNTSPSLLSICMLPPF